MNTPNATATSSENELLIYGEMTFPEGLKQAERVIVQEQYELKAPKISGVSKGKIRVRKETENGIDQYTMTTKVSADSKTHFSNEEYTISIDREYFDAFKSIATSGMKKTRYLFPVRQVTIHDPNKGEDGKSAVFKNPDAFYEVDVFTHPNGTLYAWVKIDLEMDNIMELVKGAMDDEATLRLTAIVTSLPIKPVKVFLDKKATAGEKLLLDTLYKEVFTIQMP